jgi:MacB-like protein
VFLKEGQPEPPATTDYEANWNVVTSDYFRTLGIPLVRGRTFTDRDRASSPPVIIVNETFARRMFPAGDAIGHRIRSWRDENVLREIVGVVADVRYYGLGDGRPRARLRAASAERLGSDKQRSGHIISISSSAGLAAGFEFVSAYAASEVRSRGLDGIPAGGDRAVRHRHDDRQSGILSHGTPHGAIDELWRTGHRRLRRSQEAAGRVLESPERTAIRRPGETRARADRDCERETTGAALHRGCRCSCQRRTRLADLKAQIEAHRELSTSFAFD